jgi:formiminotetrahydrofolate cyclodeaminase
LQIPAHAALAGLAQPFLDAVSRPSPTPGGGSVAALAGSLAAALGEMVAGLSSKKESQAVYEETLQQMTEQFRNAKQDLASGIDLDAASYERVLAARHLPQGSQDEEMTREKAIQSAFKGAIEAPLAAARRASSVSRQLRQLEAIASPPMISDVRVGQWMASTAVRGALENVRINLEFVTDAEFVSQTRSEADELAKAIADQP